MSNTGPAAPPFKSTTDWYVPTQPSSTSRADPAFADVEKGPADRTDGRGLQQQLSATLMYSVFDATQKGFLSSIANVDLLRPYFDIETKEVLQRLSYAMIPKPALATDTMVALPDLYGPVMLVFTMAALLQAGMKIGATQVQDGTLVGTALAIAFTYWILASLFFTTVAYVTDVNLRVLQILCITGYALLGYCVTLLANCGLPAALTTLVLIAAGGLSAGALGMIFFYNCSDSRRGMFSGALVASSHFLFLVYLRFAYASIVNAASS